MKTIVDMDAARELELYTENTSAIYHNHTMPVVENLKKKYKNGQYDKEKAIKVWEYVADAAAKMYHKEFGCISCPWYVLFKKSVRHEVAKALEEYYFEDHVCFE